MTPSRLADLHRRLGIPSDYAAVYPLPAQREARRLVLVDRAPDDGRRVRLTPRAARAWRRMHAAAEAEGIILVPLSGFRSVGRQATIIRKKLAAGQNIAAILRYVAAPGFSEHHTGRAIDIGSPEHSELDEDFDQTAAFRWLRRHAEGFGFRMSYPRARRRGIGYEPWHWLWQA